MSHLKILLTGKAKRATMSIAFSSAMYKQAWVDEDLMEQMNFDSSLVSFSVSESHRNPRTICQTTFVKIGRVNALETINHIYAVCSRLDLLVGRTVSDVTTMKGRYSLLKCVSFKEIDLSKI